jgi:dihydrofolate reductase
LGRKLYETMLVWETDPSLRDTELHAAFADVWCALPKVVFSRTLDSVQGNARLAEGSVAEEIAAALAATDKDIEIGGAGLAAAAIELGLVDELRMFRYPVVVGGGTPFLPPVTEDVPLELVETRTFGSHVIYERYRRVRGPASRPGAQRVLPSRRRERWSLLSLEPLLGPVDQRDVGGHTLLPGR